MQSSGSDWCQFIVEDANALSGQSVQDFVAPIIQQFQIKLVVTCDLQGALMGLRDHEGIPLAQDDFLKKVADATQYDWAFFFLYSQDRVPEGLTCSNINAAIMSADLTIRLVDDTYFYVYGRDKNLVTNLASKYQEAEYKICSFEQLDIPY